MSYRRIRMTVDLDENYTAYVLDNGDVVFKQLGGPPFNKAILIAAIEDRIGYLNTYVQRLHLVRDLLRLDTRMKNDMGEAKPVVKQVDNFIEYGPCPDCDSVEHLVVSQWGKTRHGDLVCLRCERIREQEYGIPLIDPD